MPTSVLLENSHTAANPNFLAGANPNFVAGANPNFVAGANPNFVAGANPNFVAGANPNFVAGANPNFAENKPQQKNGAFDSNHDPGVHDILKFLETRFPDTV